MSKVSRTWRRRNNRILKNNMKALADPKIATLTHNHFSGMTEEQLRASTGLKGISAKEKEL